MCSDLLQVIKDTYQTYFLLIFLIISKGDQQERFLEILQDSLGYLAMAINQIANLGEFLILTV